MHKDGKGNKIQVIIVHIKQSAPSTVSLLHGPLICPTALSAHICIVAFQLSNTHPAVIHSTDVMEFGAAETTPFSVRYIKNLHILHSCSVILFSYVFVSYFPLPKLLVSNMNTFNSSHGLEMAE